MLSSFMKFFDPLLGYRLVASNRDLIIQMLLRNLAARYRGSALGGAWSFAQPLLMLGVYTFVFGIVFKARWGGEQFGDSRSAFPLIMFCGMAVFNIFTESVNNSTAAVAGNPGFVKKVIFPLEILPLCNVLTSLIFGLVWFALLFMGAVLLLGSGSWTMLFLPVMLLPLLLISCGLSFLVASLGVYLRDIQQIVSIVTQVLFFMTPIFYPIELVPERIRWVLQANPLSILVEQTRRVFLFNQLPEVLPMLEVFGVSVVIFQLGLLWFSKTKKGFADVL